MPTDTAALLPLAEECERAGVEDELTAIARALDALLRAGALSDADWAKANSVWWGVKHGDLPRPCLLGAAMMLKPDKHRCGFEEAGKPDADQRGEAWCWRYHVYWKPDWREGNEGYRSHPEGCRSSAATPALALTGAFLRAHHAAAADDGEASDV
jgi:hypothetical protein